MRMLDEEGNQVGIVRHHGIKGLDEPRLEVIDSRTGKPISLAGVTFTSRGVALYEGALHPDFLHIETVMRV